MMKTYPGLQLSFRGHKLMLKRIQRCSDLLGIAFRQRFLTPGLLQCRRQDFDLGASVLGEFDSLLQRRVHAGHARLRVLMHISGECQLTEKSAGPKGVWTCKDARTQEESLDPSCMSVLGSASWFSTGYSMQVSQQSAT
eukprot:219402-Rhodomonas_salina.1